MKSRYGHLFALFLLLTLSASSSFAQRTMTLKEAIEISRSNSVAALRAKHSFVSAYWAYRSYQASRLPSFVVYGNLMNYNKSLTMLQSYEDGSVRYVNSYNLQNSLGLQISQNITMTGGHLSLLSNLSRIDQYGMARALTWYSQPVSVSYTQPLFSYNQFKWDKMIEPKEYEKSKREYLESMEQLTAQTAESYFNLLAATKRAEASRTNFENTTKMLSVASERLRLGTVTRDEYLQLELRALNDSISINQADINVREAQMALNSILGFDESVEIAPVIEETLPDIVMDYGMVLDKSFDNSTFSLSNEIDELKAASDVAQAKASRGISMSLNASFGLSQTGPAMSEAYRNPLNHEVVGLSFSIPVFDWGLGKGKVQKAKAAEEVVKAQIMQSENDYRRKIFTMVGQFNSQRQRCMASRRASEIASERYSLMMDKFLQGGATVTDLTNAQNDSDTALDLYISDLGDYWNFYYTLRTYTLYDFESGKDIDIDITELTE